MAKKIPSREKKTKSEPRRPRRATLPDRTADVPITVGHLYEVRDELKSMISNVSFRVDSLEKKFDSLEKRFDSLEKRFDSLEKKFGSLEDRFDAQSLQIASFAEQMLAQVHSVKILMEEQNERNRVAYDAVLFGVARTGRLEARMDDVEKTLTVITASKREPTA